MTMAVGPPHHRLGIRCDHWLNVMEELNIGAFVADGSRRITAINLSAQALLGLREPEVVNRDCREVFTGVPLHGRMRNAPIRKPPGTGTRIWWSPTRKTSVTCSHAWPPPYITAGVRSPDA